MSRVEVFCFTDVVKIKLLCYAIPTLNVNCCYNVPYAFYKMILSTIETYCMYFSL